VNHAFVDASAARRGPAHPSTSSSSSSTLPTTVSSAAGGTSC
jgi:hypothetical protein